MGESLIIRPKDYTLTGLDARPYHSLNVNRPLECLKLIKHLHLKASFYGILLGSLNVVDGFYLYDSTKVAEDKADPFFGRYEHEVSYPSFFSEILR